MFRFVLICGASSALVAAQTPDLDSLKQEAVERVDARRVFTQQMVDQIFSYASSDSRKSRLRGTSRASSRRTASTWNGRGRSANGVGRDLGFGQAGNRLHHRHRLHTGGVPKTRRRLPRTDVEGAPGHGEGHNSGKV